MKDRRPRGRVHLVEPGGRGGVFQHTAAVAIALHEAGVPVVVHTTSDAELTIEGPELCGCVHWSRSLPGGLRQLTTASRYLARTVPHLIRRVDAQDVVHIQGLFHPILTAVTMALLQHGGRRVAHSPHNTFARSESALDLKLIRWLARRANVVFVFSAADARVMRTWDVNPVQAQPLLYFPDPDPRRLAVWRERYGHQEVALLAGQVRPDKQPGVFLEAVAEVPGLRPAVVGEDCGAGEVCAETASRLGLDMLRVGGYLPLEDFVAAIAAADVVVATNVVGSVSGPIAMARALGVRTVAARVGGLEAQAMVIADRADRDGFADAISRALTAPSPPRERQCAESLAHQTLAGYAIAGWSP